MKLIIPLFWKKKNFLSFLLYPLTLFTFLINALKQLGHKKKFYVKTICVGNIYVGGTGKTPLALKINELLKDKYKTVFIKKKYENQSDERQLLKFNGKLISENKRTDALKVAQDKNYNVAIIDDGLQEKNIEYDISIVCFNSYSGIGNGLLIPAGPLRENISSIKNYDAVFINGGKKNKELSSFLKKINKKIDIFEGNYIPTNLKEFKNNKNCIIFSGIGNPEEFERTLIKYKFKIKEKHIFPDHYDFSNKEINDLKNIAKSKKLQIITTEKDYLRLNKKNKKNIKYLKINLQIKEKKKFVNFLHNRL